MRELVLVGTVTHTYLMHTTFTNTHLKGTGCICTGGDYVGSEGEEMSNNLT